MGGIRMHATRTLEATQTTNYNYAIGYLRAFLVVLVVLHHTALAYHPVAPMPPASLLAQPPFWQAFPVVDAHKWSFAGAFVGFNDIFFMSLMFLLSGLFVAAGLKRKGAAHFLRDRLVRLGLPFVVAVAILAPLAYYPTYLQTPNPSGMAAFAHQWLALGRWPSGPAWFIWVLLAFDAIAALLFALAPNWTESLGRILSPAFKRPITFFAALAFASAVVYIPMALIFNSESWAAFGPFTFQTSRIFHYLVYFLFGVAAGACGIETTLFAPGSRLAKRWPLWVLASLVCFIAVTGLALSAYATRTPSLALIVTAHAGFALSCAASSFAFLAIFLRFVHTPTRAFGSLAANSYAIYLLHYVVVSWLLYAFVPASLAGLVKFAIVAPIALAVTWALAPALRTIPALARII
jgi:peptidoglycan/LPS O-acetylase OafA/YrhL